MRLNYLEHDRGVIKSALKQKSKTELILNLVWLFGFLLPMLFNQSNQKLKTFILSFGMIGMVGSLCYASRDKEEDKYLRNLEKISTEQRSNDLKNVYLQNEMSNEINRNKLLFAAIMQQPKELHQDLLVKYDLVEYVRALIKAQTPPITVEASQVPNQAYSGSIGQSSVDWNVEGITFPMEDIAKLFVESSLDKSSARGVFMLAPPRVGKTDMMKIMIHNAHQMTDGVSDFLIFAGKHNQTYAGLENDSNRYLYSGNSKLSSQVAARLNTIVDELNYTEYTRFVIADEWNSTRLASSSYDRKADKKDKTLPDLDTAAETLINRGSSQGTIWVMSSHTKRKDDLGLNDGIYHGMSMIVLGRVLSSETKDGTSKVQAYGSIKETLSGNNSIVDNSQLREVLYEEFMEYINHPQANDRTEVLCLTNIGSNWRLCTLPRYDLEAAGLDPIYQDSFDSSEPKKVEPTEVKKQNFQLFVEWCSEQSSGNISDSEIAFVFNRYMGQTATAQTIAMIREKYIGKDINLQDQ